MPKKTRPPDVAAIATRALTKTWPNGVEAVKHLDLVVAPGEIFGLLGANGAGKSTTVGMLTTTVRPTAGDAALFGNDVATDAIAARSVSAVVFQDAVVDDALTGRQNLRTHARLWGLDAALTVARITEQADYFGLADLLDRPVSTYSGGQRRRLEIARSLLSAPGVLFLDEPTVGLDPRIRFELLDLIAGLREQERMTVLLTTHYLDEAERLCDRVAIMHRGAIVGIGAPRDLLAGFADEVLELRVDHDPDQALARLRKLGIADDSAFAVGSTITVPLRERAASDAAAAVGADGLAVVATSIRRPTLDDVYLRLTGDRLAA